MLEAYTALYERYLPVVYKRVRYVVPEQDVEDVTQEIFLAVIKSLKGFRGESQFRTWLRTLINRQVADYYRHRSPPEKSLDADENGEITVRSYASDSREYHAHLDDCIELREALGNLPERYREILLMRFADGLRFSEIAVQNGQSLEAAKSLFRRAVAALHKQMGISISYVRSSRF